MPSYDKNLFRKLSAQFLCGSTFLASLGSTSLLTIFTVYAYFESKPTRIPFTIVAVCNGICTGLIIVFSLWKSKRRTAITLGILPTLSTTLATAGLFTVSVVKWTWLPHVVVGRDARWLLTATIWLWGVNVILLTVFWTLVIICIAKGRGQSLLAMREKARDRRSILSMGSAQMRGRNIIHDEDSAKRPGSSIPGFFSRLPKTPSRTRVRTPVPIDTSSPSRSTNSSPRSNSAGAQPSSPFLTKLQRARAGSYARDRDHSGSYPIPFTHKENEAVALFDTWDTSSISIRDRAVYSLAAAAESPPPGSPPHTGSFYIAGTESNDGSIITPPQTPPYRDRNDRSSGLVRQETQTPLSQIGFALTRATLTSSGIPSTDDSNCSSPSPHSPPRPKTSRGPPVPPYQEASYNILNITGPDLSLCEESNASYLGDSAWQARWAAQLERKVTPPMPGFEVSPYESMRRMKEHLMLQTERERMRKQSEAKYEYAGTDTNSRSGDSNYTNTTTITTQINPDSRNLDHAMLTSGYPTPASYNMGNSQLASGRNQPIGPYTYAAPVRAHTHTRNFSLLTDLRRQNDERKMSEAGMNEIVGSLRSGYPDSDYSNGSNMGTWRRGPSPILELPENYTMMYAEHNKEMGRSA